MNEDPGERQPTVLRLVVGPDVCIEGLCEHAPVLVFRPTEGLVPIAQDLVKGRWQLYTARYARVLAVACQTVSLIMHGGLLVRQPHGTISLPQRSCNWSGDLRSTDAHSK